MKVELMNVHSRSKIGRVLRIILIALFIIFICVSLLYFQRIRTLMSLKEVDSHPLYIMEYYGIYEFEDYLKVGSNSPRDLYNFINKELFGPFSSSSIDISKTEKFACTSFSAKDTNNNPIFGRNYDFSDNYASLLLYAAPPGGYRSVSMVNIDFAKGANILGQKDNSPITSWKRRELLLGAPYLPFDGMNEYGLVASVNSVPISLDYSAANSVSKKTIGFPQAIRLLLDHAKNLEEAITLLDEYNIDFVSNNLQPIHFHIADADDNSAVVEYINGKTQVYKSGVTWSVATNFVLYENSFDPLYDKRYITANNELMKSNGFISTQQAVTLLNKVSQEGLTNWSVLYNQKTGDINIVMGSNFDKVLKFKLNMAN